MPRPKKETKSTSKRKLGSAKKDIEDGSQSKYFKKEKVACNASYSSDALSNVSAISNKRLPYSFYNQPCQDLAKILLGKKVVRKLPSGEIVSGIIVETEAYLGGEDKAAHSYNGKRTEKNEAMYMAPGTAYVYHIYGTYTCLNISSKGKFRSRLQMLYHCE